MSVVIDTNVAIVANGGHQAASGQCIGACIDALLAARGDVVLVDDGQEILAEYKDNLSFAGQPGVGDAFFKWLWNNQANPSCCRKIVITPCDPRGDLEFEEFPNDPALSRFDRSDRKFVAVALTSGESPPILNASDSDWWIHKEALERNGVILRFLCPELMKDAN